MNLRDADLRGIRFWGARLLAASLCDEVAGPETMTLGLPLDAKPQIERAALDALTPGQQTALAKSPFKGVPIEALMERFLHFSTFS